ncbi:hypothetical protein D6825_02335 [Candidatus Woesearchaeota archaeon]|nr:MAG: hypothetical protein D6825_02335 [Candidatus Woesearchaeota archaeon]
MAVFFFAFFFTFFLAFEAFFAFFAGFRAFAFFFAVFFFAAGAALILFFALAGFGSFFVFSTLGASGSYISPQSLHMSCSLAGDLTTFNDAQSGHSLSSSTSTMLF